MAHLGTRSGLTTGLRWSRSIDESYGWTTRLLLPNTLRVRVVLVLVVILVLVVFALNVELLPC